MFFYNFEAEVQTDRFNNPNAGEDVVIVWLEVEGYDTEFTGLSFYLVNMDLNLT